MSPEYSGLDYILDRKCLSFHYLNLRYKKGCDQQSFIFFPWAVNYWLQLRPSWSPADSTNHPLIEFVLLSSVLSSDFLSFSLCQLSFSLYCCNGGKSPQINSINLPSTWNSHLCFLSSPGLRLRTSRQCWAQWWVVDLLELCWPGRWSSPYTTALTTSRKTG